MKNLFIYGCFLLLAMLLWSCSHEKQPVKTIEKPNILFITCDQRMFQDLGVKGFHQPGIERLAAQGVSFKNHYIASAVCTPSRGVLYSGRAPQVTGIQEEMMFGWTPSLSTEESSVGTAMKQLGYTTAYFGKWELDTAVVFPKPGVNYADTLKRFGFDEWQPYGDVTGEKDQGYQMDGVIAAEGISWLRTNAETLQKNNEPWFLTLSFINPHDIFFADVNPPGEKVQQGLPGITGPIPADAQTKREWDFPMWKTHKEPLQAPGRPPAHWEYYQATCNVVGEIPVEREDMWHAYENYYLNLLQENDRCIEQVLEALDDLNLWKNTVVVFTSDHGEICGSHGGLRNKGPVSYEQNVHVPMIVVYPGVQGGQTTQALTSHIDVFPTLVGLTGAPKEKAADITQGLPGRDFSSVLKDPTNAPLDAVRPGVLFNYVGLSTIDAEFYQKMFESWGDLSTFAMTPEQLANHPPDLTKRGFVAMTFDGRYKFARYYAPKYFNTPVTFDELVEWNDLELYDLQNDPDEQNNLATNPEENSELILRMNALMNDLMAREVGENNGKFLPASVRHINSIKIK
jgi:arylsulfatase A-like enzyme